MQNILRHLSCNFLHRGAHDFGIGKRLGLFFLLLAVREEVVPTLNSVENALILELNALGRGLNLHVGPVFPAALLILITR